LGSLPHSGIKRSAGESKPPAYRSFHLSGTCFEISRGLRPEWTGRSEGAARYNLGTLLLLTAWRTIVLVTQRFAGGSVDEMHSCTRWACHEQIGLIINGLIFIQPCMRDVQTRSGASEYKAVHRPRRSRSAIWSGFGTIFFESKPEKTKA
jgi:hypothetical protein